MTRTTRAAAAALLVLALAACDSGAPVEEPTPDDAGVAEPTETDATEPDPATDPADELAAALLTGEDLGAGWEVMTSDEDDDAEATGGVCAFDLDAALPPDAQTVQADASFQNGTLMAFASQGLMEMAGAEAFLTAVLAELEGCVGPVESVDGDTTALITSEPIGLTVPGAAVSGCRYAETIVNGMPLFGPFCFGATGDRVLMLMTATPDAAGGMTPEEFTGVMAAAAAKAFAG